jgi:hypothetical protein
LLAAESKKVTTLPARDLAPDFPWLLATTPRPGQPSDGYKPVTCEITP